MQSLSTDIYTKLVNAKIFIDHHFSDPIDLDMIASKTHMSPFHFHRLFTKVYRITPHQYITKKRLEKAKELLKTGELSISNICTGIGFESHGSFTLLFKRSQGIAPKIFRTRAIEKQQRAIEQPRYVIPHCFLRSEEK